MHILYIVHGFPPRENAGTEQHCRSCFVLFCQRHRVSVITATREIGKRQHTVYHEVIQNISIWRIVNNIPTRPLPRRIFSTDQQLGQKYRQQNQT